MPPIAPRRLERVELNPPRYECERGGGRDTIKSQVFSPASSLTLSPPPSLGSLGHLVGTKAVGDVHRASELTHLGTDLPGPTVNARNADHSRVSRGLTVDVEFAERTLYSVRDSSQLENSWDPRPILLRWLWRCRQVIAELQLS
jgi:hypothetical protein